MKSPKLYTISISVSPFDYQIEFKGSRKAAEQYAQRLELSPFEGFDISDFVTSRVCEKTGKKTE